MSSAMLSAANAGCGLRWKVPSACWRSSVPAWKVPPPRKTSSRPSPSTSATASAGPSVESIRGMSGSRSKSTNAFSTWRASTRRASVTSRKSGVGAGAGDQRSCASRCESVSGRFAGTLVSVCIERSGQTTRSESTTLSRPSPTCSRGSTDDWKPRVGDCSTSCVAPAAPHEQLRADAEACSPPAPRSVTVSDAFPVWLRPRLR